MAKITIFLLSVSTIVLLITVGQGIGVLRGGDVHDHLYWAMATLFGVLGANLFAIFHAAQSDRVIRELRNFIHSVAPEPPAEGETSDDSAR